VEPRWLAIAYEELQLRVQEVPGASANPRIVEYHQATALKATSDEVPWCAAFVSYCLERSFVTSTHSAAARSYLDWGVGVSVVHPPLGAIVVLARGAGAPGREVRNAPGHVGFFWSHGEPGWISLLGGNQGDSVSIRSFPVSRLLGVRWAAF